MRIRIFIAPLVCLASLTLAYCAAIPTDVYITEAGIEPDKWASVWLIKRRISPEAKIVMHPVGLPLDGGIVFAAGDGPFGRSPSQGAFGNMLAALNESEDRALLELASYLNVIELSAWMSAEVPEAALIEQEFRSLQEYYGRDSVPEACYLSFFDATYELILQKKLSSLPSRARQFASPAAECHSGGAVVQRNAATTVRSASAAEALTRINRGERVVFIDVREAPEFFEEHIPGALQRTLREIDQPFVDSLRKADLVIPYCVKDFRGYEAARELQRLGLANVAILKPFGIAGWKSAGLPLWRRGVSDEQSAINSLRRCAEQGGLKCVQL